MSIADLHLWSCIELAGAACDKNLKVSCLFRARAFGMDVRAIVTLTLILNSGTEMESDHRSI